MLEDKELEKIACFKLGKFETQELQIDDLSKIEEINISNRKLSGDKKNISLQELRLFPNLKRISLQYFTIDNSVIEILNMLKELETLQLSSCKIISDIVFQNQTLKSLCLNCCDINNYNSLYAPEVLEIIGIDNFRLDKILGKEYIKKLYMQSTRVKGFSTIDKCINLKSLNLDGSKVDDNKKIEELKKRISVSQLDEYLPIR